MSTEPLRRLGKYELLQSLGHGGMAEVWKARDTQLQRFVAIKLLHANLQADPDFVARFQREAQAIASLRHPNIVQIHDFQVSLPPESSARGRHWPTILPAPPPGEKSPHRLRSLRSLRLSAWPSTMPIRKA